MLVVICNLIDNYELSSISEAIVSDAFLARTLSLYDIYVVELLETAITYASNTSVVKQLICWRTPLNNINTVVLIARHVLFVNKRFDPVDRHPRGVILIIQSTSPSHLCQQLPKLLYVVCFDTKFRHAAKY